MPTTTAGTAYTVSSFTSSAGESAWRCVADAHASDTDIPLVVFCHGNPGATGTSADQQFQAGYTTVREWIIDNGWAFVEGHGAGANWGNQAGRDAYEAMVTDVRGVWSIGFLFVIGRSMGGLVGAWLASRSSVVAPKCIGYIGLSPTQDLQNRYSTAGGTDITNMNAAYGVSNDAQWRNAVVDFDPMLAPMWSWRGRNAIQQWDDSDTTVPATINGQAWYARFASYAPLRIGRTFSTTGGDHNTTPNDSTQNAATISFLSDVFASYDGDWSDTWSDTWGNAAGASSGSTITGTAAITSAGTVGKSATVTVAGIAAVTTDGVVGKTSTTTIAGVAGVSSAGSVAASTGASVAGSVSIAAAGAVATSGGVSVAGVGSVTAGGVVGTSAGSSISGTASVSAAGSAATGPTVLLAGTGTITAAGVVGKTAGASIGGVAALTAGGSKGLNAGSTIAGTGSILAAGSTSAPGGVSIAGTGTLTASGVVGRAAGASLAGVAIISAAGVVSGGGGPRDIVVTAVLGRRDKTGVLAGRDKFGSIDRRWEGTL